MAFALKFWCSPPKKRESITMDYKLFILSLACLSCLTPPALGSLLALKAAAAVKGAALLGAGALAVKGAAIKGAVVKGAAIKGALIKGAALKGAAIKGAAIGAVKLAAAKGAAVLAAKAAAVKGALALAHKVADSLAVHKLPSVQPIIIEKPSLVPILPANTVQIQTSPPALPSIVNSLTSLWSAAADQRFGGVLDVLEPRPIVRAPIVYEAYRYAEPARFYPVPVLDDDCA